MLVLLGLIFISPLIFLGLVSAGVKIAYRLREPSKLKFLNFVARYITSCFVVAGFVCLAVYALNLIFGFLS